MKQENHHYKKSFLQLRERKFRSATFMSSIFYYNYEMVIHEWQKHNTRFLSLSLSLQTPLSLSNTQKSDKKRRRDGFTNLVSSFALYFIVSELVLSFIQSGLALYFIVIGGSIFLSFLKHWGSCLSLSHFLKLFAHF